MIIGFRVTSVPSDFGMFASFSYLLLLLSYVLSLCVCRCVDVDGWIGGGQRQYRMALGRLPHSAHHIHQLQDGRTWTTQPAGRNFFTVPARSCSCRKIP